MDEQKGLLYYMETLTQLSEFWVVNYYLRSMKKAPHGGVVRIYYPNIYLKHYPFQVRTFICHEPENVPFFMENLLDKAISLYYDCNVDLEEMLQYCYNGDNWYVGYRLLHPKPEYVELNSKMSGTLLCSILGEDKRITDYFDIEIKYAVYSLILCLIQERAITIRSLSEILCNEKLKEPYNKYGLTKVTNVEFLRQGFRIENTYYQYNIFLDPTICSPMDTMPYTFRIITDEIEGMELSLRCDNNLAVPFDKMLSTASKDLQKFHGITVDFANIEALLHKEIVVHIHPELMHKIILVIKPDIENDDAFYHIEVEQLWSPDVVKDDIVLATFVHAKYFPSKQAFTHIDFSVNQYESSIYAAKYAEAINDTGVPIDKYCDVHYKVWCVEAGSIGISTWSKLVCATLDEPFRDIFLETFKQ